MLWQPSATATATAHSYHLTTTRKTRKLDIQSTEIVKMKALFRMTYYGQIWARMPSLRRLRKNSSTVGRLSNKPWDSKGTRLPQPQLVITSHLQHNTITHENPNIGESFWQKYIIYCYSDEQRLNKTSNNKYKNTNTNNTFVIRKYLKCNSKKNSSTRLANSGSDSKLNAMGISV